MPQYLRVRSGPPCFIPADRKNSLFACIDKNGANSQFLNVWTWQNGQFVPPPTLHTHHNPTTLLCFGGYYVLVEASNPYVPNPADYTYLPVIPEVIKIAPATEIWILRRVDNYHFNIVCLPIVHNDRIKAFRANYRFEHLIDVVDTLAAACPTARFIGDSFCTVGKHVIPCTKYGLGTISTTELAIRAAYLYEDCRRNMTLNVFDFDSLESAIFYHMQVTLHQRGIPLGLVFKGQPHQIQHIDPLQPLPVGPIIVSTRTSLPNALFSRSIGMQPDTKEAIFINCFDKITTAEVLRIQDYDRAHRSILLRAFIAVLDQHFTNF